MTTEAIYQRPEDYDLEHVGDHEDVRFYCALLKRLQPASVLEFACGSGRITTALAAALPEVPIVGVDSSREMLAQARRALAESSTHPRRLEFVEGDMRSWQSEQTFDVVLISCCSASHLVALDDRLLAWATAYRLLSPGGRFIVDARMPDLATLAESQRATPRSLVQLDLDSSERSTGSRLLRCAATRYEPHEQRAQTRYLYDKFEIAEPTDRFVSDFESHVYFPSELELLFATSGFSDCERYGNYDFSRLGRISPYVITVARKSGQRS